MMKGNRIERVKAGVDGVLAQMEEEQERRRAFVHLYGVAQACAMLALKRREDVELAGIAGMLHDLYAYAAADRTGHANKGGAMAKEFLDRMGGFSQNEIEKISTAIGHHSEKTITHSAFDEILKDADILQHFMHNPLLHTAEHESPRLAALRAEFGL